MVTKNMKSGNIELREINNIINRLEKGTPDKQDRANIELSGLAVRTKDPLVLCRIAIYSRDRDTLNKVLAESGFFGESMKNLTVINFAGNRYSDPIRLDWIARGRYSTVAKMSVVGNPSTDDSTIKFLAINSANKELRKMAENELSQRPNQKSDEQVKLRVCFPPYSRRNPFRSD